MATEGALRRAIRIPRQGVVRAFRWHLLAFAVLNAALNVANALTGRPWWAFWPLIVSGFLLGLHYLFYKSATADEHWADERVEELNLKSYDRSHIEELKTRYRGDAASHKADRGAP
jgi:2TM domain